MNNACAQCSVALDMADGHVLCLHCLGMEHLKQALTEDACVNCSSMPLAERRARLAAAQGSELPPSGMPVLSPVKGLSKSKRSNSKQVSEKPDTRKSPGKGPLKTKHSHTTKAVVEKAEASKSRQGTEAKKARREVQNPPSGVEAQHRVAQHPPVHTVESLATEFAQIRALLYNLQPGTSAGAVGAPTAAAPATLAPQQQARGTGVSQAARGADLRDEDAISIAASDSLFAEEAGEYDYEYEDEDQEEGDLLSEAGSLGSEAQEPGNISAVEDLQLALSRLGIEVATEEACANAFFKKGSEAPFRVPPSTAFITELQSCWHDPKTDRRPSQDCRAMGAMADAAKFGLDRMPAVENPIASLVVSPDEALGQNPRCPLAQCRLTDEYITHAYDSAARMARVSNSLSHLILALDKSLVDAGADRATQSLSEASLRAFAYMSKDLGKVMSTLTLARRQVWLAQAPVSQQCKKKLCKLPVVPGQVFGPPAQEALERCVEAKAAKRQFADLQTPARRSWRGRGRQPAVRGRGFYGRPSFQQGLPQPQQGPPQPSFKFPRGRPPRRGTPAGRASRTFAGRGGRA